MQYMHEAEGHPFKISTKDGGNDDTFLVILTPHDDYEINGWNPHLRSLEPALLLKYRGELSNKGDCVNMPFSPQSERDRVMGMVSFDKEEFLQRVEDV